MPYCCTFYVAYCMLQVVSECTKMEMSQAHIVHVFMLLVYEFNQLKTVNPRWVGQRPPALSRPIFESRLAGVALPCPFRVVRCSSW